MSGYGWCGEHTGTWQWTQPVNVSTIPGRANQNPVLFYDRGDQNLYLFHTSQRAIEHSDGRVSETTSFVVRLVSEDHGATWGPPLMVSDLSNSRGAALRGNVVLSADGDEWLLPMYYTPEARHASRQYCTLRRSRDKGLTWTVRASSPATLSSAGCCGMVPPPAPTTEFTMRLVLTVHLADLNVISCG
jgi:predicted neuraminidase